MPSIAVGIICKTPRAGLSKTRLSPPLRPEDCAALSECFIRDLAATIGTWPRQAASPAMRSTPRVGSEPALRAHAAARVSACWRNRTATSVHACSMPSATCSPPATAAPSWSIPTARPCRSRSCATRCARLRQGDVAVLGPALDGGYTLIGLSEAACPPVRRHPLEHAAGLSADARARARDRLPVINVPQWYDIDDEYTLRLLQAELAGERLEFAAPGVVGAAGALHARNSSPTRSATHAGKDRSRDDSSPSRSNDAGRRDAAALVALCVLGLGVLSSMPYC